ncbi:MAG: hypothetical protein IJ705_02625 [Oscillospiraceae bacterium]|nr:hypothetical protein [Oscillospiraceae bacterium]
MPALLGPTNPVQGYDPQPVRIQTTPSTDTSIQNVINTEVVTRPDSRTDRQDNNDSSGSQAARYESNFMTFLQRLRSSQNLSETVMRVLQYRGTEVSSGIGSGFAREMSQFLEFTNMDEAQMTAFLRNQFMSSTRFTGALFDALRAALGGSASELLQNEILLFLRRFSDYSATEHLEARMLRTVSDIADATPGKWSDQVRALLASLQDAIANGDRQAGLNLMRQQLFPLVSRYVSTTHDHGLARGLLSMLTLDLARYENGAESGLLQSLRHLASSGILPGSMAQLSDEELLQMLRNTEYYRASQQNLFADQMASLASRALRGEGGVGMQEAFHNILNSVLINESVYMPLQHIMLPMNWNGNLMFAEMWVDPDADKGAGQGGGGKSMRILIKMDIASLGAFDVLIDARRDSVALAVAGPPTVSAHASDVSAALGEILRRNGLNVGEISVSVRKRPVTISEVFPKIYERMDGVNVKV